jgi:hypothetical protein
MVVEDFDSMRVDIPKNDIIGDGRRLEGRQYRVVGFPRSEARAEAPGRSAEIEKDNRGRMTKAVLSGEPDFLRRSHRLTVPVHSVNDVP